jgi:hypothetical protein
MSKDEDYEIYLKENESWIDPKDFKNSIEAEYIKGEYNIRLNKEQVQISYKHCIKLIFLII